MFGISGSGKSTYCKGNFKDTEIVSTDQIRVWITDDETNQDCNLDVFDMFYNLIDNRMKYKRTVIADATNLNNKTRKKLIELAKKHNYNAHLIIKECSLETAIKRNMGRDLPRPEFVINRQHNNYLRAINNVEKEGYNKIEYISEKN